MSFANQYQCAMCAASVNPARYEIGYTTCKPCGEKAARKVKHCIVPIHKSSYIVVTDRTLLSQLGR